MTKQQALDTIAAEIATCKICKVGKTGLPVPGEGSPAAKVMFVGEAPGKQEAKTGRPFIGRSGQLLRTLIKEAGLKEEDVYITSPVKYLPLRGTPTPQDIAHAKIHYDKQVAVIQPEVIVLLGSVAARANLTQPVSVTKQHGQIIEEHGRKYLVTYHPAAVLRFPKYKPYVLEDFKKLKDLL